VTTSALLVDLNEAAARLSLSKRFIQTEIYAGRLKSCKAGRRRVIAIADLENYVERLRSENDCELTGSRLVRRGT
jgi:excisionase family DNA binding protein